MSDVFTTQDEFFQTMTAQIERLRQTRSSVVISLAGGSCSGKSLTCDALRERYGESLTYFPLDTFQLGWDFAERDTSPYRWDDPRHFCPAEAFDCFSQLMKAGKVTVPVFDLKENRRTSSTELKRREIVLIDGLYSLRESFAGVADLAIYLEAPFFLRFFRRIQRFTSEVNPAGAYTTSRHLLRNVYDAHKDFVAPQRGVADLIYRQYPEITGEFASLECEVPEIGHKVFQQVINSLTAQVQVELVREGSTSLLWCLRENGRLRVKQAIDPELAEKASQVDWSLY